MCWQTYLLLSNYLTSYLANLLTICSGMWYFWPNISDSPPEGTTSAAAPRSPTFRSSPLRHAGSVEASCWPAEVLDECRAMAKEGRWGRQEKEEKWGGKKTWMTSNLKVLTWQVNIIRNTWTASSWMTLSGETHTFTSESPKKNTNMPISNCWTRTKWTPFHSMSDICSGFGPPEVSSLCIATRCLSPHSAVIFPNLANLCSRNKINIASFRTQSTYTFRWPWHAVRISYQGRNNGLPKCFTCDSCKVSKPGAVRPKGLCMLSSIPEQFGCIHCTTSRPFDHASHGHAFDSHEGSDALSVSPTVAFVCLRLF